MKERYIVTLEGVRLTQRSGVPTSRDIAVNHARTPMFGGHTNLFYSVAHHCLAAAELAQEARLPEHGPLAIALFTLLHEAEVVAYGDIPGPVKIQEQRVVEADFRARLFEQHGTPLPGGIWHQVEFYDKVEQAASASWLGLAETVHDGVWASTPDDLKARAVAVTRRLYEEFPPEKQLGVDAPIVYRFLYKLSEYRAGYLAN